MSYLFYHHLVQLLRNVFLLVLCLHSHIQMLFLYQLFRVS